MRYFLNSAISITYLPFPSKQAVNFTSSENLLTHINGAATLLSERINRNSGNADLHGFLLELFCYFYTLAATTHGHQMKVDTALAFQIFHCPMLLEHRIQGMLLGSSPKLFYIILRLSMVLNNDCLLYTSDAADEMD